MRMTPSKKPLSEIVCLVDDDPLVLRFDWVQTRFDRQHCGTNHASREPFRFSRAVPSRATENVKAEERDVFNGTAHTANSVRRGYEAG